MRSVIAMSGGVDSSVALFLTKENQPGGDILGVTLALAERGTVGEQADRVNIADAADVCLAQNTEHTAIYAYPEFSAAVIDYFTSEYFAGRTPNPCVICNREIKFGLLYEYAEKNGFERVVTGHYVRTEECGGYTYIKKAADLKKDQSYVLARLSQKQLKHAYFPLGEYTKDEVRNIAEKLGFVNARRHDSQDICFIPDGDYISFITRRTGIFPEPGDYLDENGRVMGKHGGQWRYTIGQRKGLGISAGKHIFVLSKDAEKNTVTLGDENRLMKKTVRLSDLNIPSNPHDLDGDVRCEAKLRYAHRAAPAVFHRTDEKSGVLEFNEAQRAPSPGQLAVIYSGDIVIGAGTIEWG